jgi:hypothetical protein
MGVVGRGRARDECAANGRETAQRYAVEQLGDGRFWERARERPKASSRPLSTWHAELVRLEAFQQRAGERWTARRIYALWELVDRPRDTS